MKTSIQRFKVSEFPNRSGSTSYRVSGTTRQGKRIRENFDSHPAASCRQMELESEFLSRKPDDVILRATALTPEQLKIAEAAFLLAERDEDLLIALRHWQTHGKKANGDAPRLDDAVGQFRTWLKNTESLRHKSKVNLRTRVKVFGNSSPNVRVNEIDGDFIDDFLSKRDVDATTRNNDKRAISRFFSWCMERPRRWCIANPCQSVKVEKGEDKPPEVLSVVSCNRILRKAEKHKDGILVPYVAVCLFAGLRPFEAQRLTWQQVNLTDREIRLEAAQTKNKRARVVHIDNQLHAWLKAHKNKPFFPKNHRKLFRAVLASAGFGTPTKERKTLKPYPQDAMRHTAISMHFRKHQSYGAAAERFGNSETIIKQHYQGRVSTKEMEAFCKITPG